MKPNNVIMNNNLNEIKNNFYKIKQLGFVPDRRENNVNGGIGNTYEDLLGVKENNLKTADYLGFEIKSKRIFNPSYISLFSKSPSFPRKASSYLREVYGEKRNGNHSEKKILYASVFGNKFSSVYKKYKMKLQVNHREKKLYLKIFDIDGKLLDSLFWTFTSLKRASGKMKSLMLVLAEEESRDGKRYFHYRQAEIYHLFSFRKFLQNIQSGAIMFYIGIGVYNSGKNTGQIHDHGNGFRIQQENLKNLYCSFETV